MANLPPNTQRIIPYLSYKNGKSAIDFLAKAFGFEVRMVMPGPGESVMHAELGLGDAVVYLGTPPGYDAKRATKERNAAVLVYVDDVDVHCARAREAGAKIESEPADQFYGDRTYNAVDPEGQMWFFHTHVRDVSPEEMQAAMANMPAPAPSAAPKRAKKAPRARIAKAKAAPKPRKPARKK
ncbi:MAG TPA: VOC family protein [Myxococcota bacterium]|nr:VOC family protein [Myxococcota bacterium]